MGNEEKIEGQNKAHILVIPAPVQGHINPMLQFSSRLLFSKLKVTLLIFTDKQVYLSGSLSVTVETIYLHRENSSDELLELIQAAMSTKIQEIFTKYKDNGSPLSCVVYDSLMPWMLNIVRPFGVAGAPFFTHSAAVCTVFYDVCEGKLRVPVEEQNVKLGGGVSLSMSEKFCNTSITKLMIDQFCNFRDVDWAFFNSFTELEKEVVTSLASTRPIKLIGPTIPSAYMDKQLPNNSDYGLAIFKHNTDYYIEWLNSKQARSVVYVSFGTIATLEEEQVAEIASRLKNSNHYLLWVVRESEQKKLPTNFEQQTPSTGLVVSWCQQLEVLSHKSVGCFLTHCGWNSTLEGVSLGVPMIGVPQWADQTTNAKFIADVWEVGVKVKADEKGVVRREEVEFCIKEIMEGEKGKKIKKNADKLRILAVEAVDRGGSSDKDIGEFVAELTSKSCGGCTVFR